MLFSMRKGYLIVKNAIIKWNLLYDRVEKEKRMASYFDAIRII